MNIPIYDGVPLWNPNATAFGFYNNDVEFQEDSVKEYKDQDIKFLKFCQQAISDNKVVEYWCSW